MYDLVLTQPQLITFVMVDISNTEVPGLGNTYVMEISKAGGAFAPSIGVKAEMSNGWYSYLLDTTEVDTVGPLSIRVNAAGCVQQNLEYIVEKRVIYSIEFTYTITDNTTLLPIEGAQVWFSTDYVGTHIVWSGFTDTFGVARDTNGNLPRLDPGTYYVRRNKAGYIFADPDTEIVSP